MAAGPEPFSDEFPEFVCFVCFACSLELCLQSPSIMAHVK